VRVLIACEFSGIVRDAFIDAGHDATSIDLLPSESPRGPHIIGNVLDYLDGNWALMIAHPPCTYLASSGARWWPQRQAPQAAALKFVRALMDAPIPRIAIENPVGIISTAIRKSDQIIQPFQFGHFEWKTTCLWLKGLPQLIPTDNVQADTRVGGGKRPGRIYSEVLRFSPHKDRAHERSRTFTGIAQAMAQQWGNADISHSENTP
jgi:hypothetical protein